MEDRRESVTLAEPLIVGEDSPRRIELNDLALELAEKSASLRATLPASMRRSLADAVRSMNCYYSNLIEGHDTHPIDIERALADDFSVDPEQRDLQLEAKSHIEVQRWVDNGGLSEHPTSPAMLKEMHRRFCENLPSSLLVTRDPVSGEEVEIIPGEFRTGFVKVGNHIPVSPGAVPRFLDHLHKSYTRPGRISGILGVACAHHRLSWVHPFTDLNGRVMRMVSHATFLQVVNSEGLWSVSRGLARREQDYKRLIAAADEPRQGDRDGRGNLSESRLADFAKFFLEVSIDQVDFMASLMKPEDLRNRIFHWIDAEVKAGNLPGKSEIIMREVLWRGEIDRGEVASFLGVKDRMARNVTSKLVASGALVADSSRAPLRLSFSPKLAGKWMPGLFPEKTS